MWQFLSTVMIGCVTGMDPAESPKNLDLIASMPPGTESVLVVRRTAFAGDGAVFPFLAAGDMFRAQEKNQEIRDVAMTAIEAAHPTVGAWGGSAFAKPQGLGAGRYKERMIIWTKDALDPLTKQLAEPAGIKGFGGVDELEGIKVYRGRETLHMDDRDNIAAQKGKPATRDWYVAVPDPHTLVMAEKKDDVQQMVKALRSKDHQVPPQWKAAAKGLDLESPLVILRKYDPKNENDAYSPVNPKAPVRADIDSAGLVIPKPKDRLLKLHVVTKAPAEAQGALQFQVLTGMGWKRSDTEDGFNADVRFDEKNDVVELQLMIFFGPNIAI